MARRISFRETRARKAARQRYAVAAAVAVPGLAAAVAGFVSITADPYGASVTAMGSLAFIGVVALVGSLFIALDNHQ